LQFVTMKWNNEVAMTRSRSSLRHIAPVLGLVFSGLLGCSGSGDQNATPGTPAGGGGSVTPGSAQQGLITSDLPRDETPDATAQDVAATAQGERAFTWDLYHKVVQPSQNLFVSPYSITTALAMAYAAADGQTKTEMAQALHYTLADPPLHASFNALSLALKNRNLPATDKIRALKLSVNNALWGEKGRMPLPSYLDTLAVNYGTGMYLVDFAAPEETRQTINAAVAGWTEQRIEELLKPGILTSATTLVLTNTIYLFAPWQTQFVESNTAPAAFTAEDGTTADAPTMNGDVDGRYAAGEGYEVLALPYRSGELELVIALPAAGSYATFESSLDQARVDQLVAGLAPTRVRVHLPKFSLRTPVSLNEPLKALGMVSAFAGGFPGLGPADNSISDVVHEAFVDVTEEGTEAAAATAVVFWEIAAPSPQVEVSVDHPFVFFIRDVPTDTVLFVGRVLSLP
jgi:serpin B